VKLGHGFLSPTPAKPNIGDVLANGVFFSTSYISKAPISRISGIKDGTGTTLMFAENCHKSYLAASHLPTFCWLGRHGWPVGEQNLGIVWVVPNQGTSPRPGDTIHDQERICGNEADLVHFDHDKPRFARPASAHGSGANVAFCDGHNQYLRDDIDYVVYVQLMTTDGRKCVDPLDHDNKNTAMTAFRNAPPLAEKDYN
jgi:prepilin-type processing-associated H-X9-DG protein